MKKFIYLIVLFLTCYSVDNLNAQSFSFTNLGPVFVQYPYYPDSIQFVSRRAIVRNNSSANINFRFARIVNNMPTGWYTQMAYDTSYPLFIDTISLPLDPPLSIPPNHQDTSFEILFTYEGPGLGTAIVRMYNTDNPAEYVQDTFKVQIGTVGITNVSNSIKEYSLSQNYPNPFNPTTNINFSIPESQKVNLTVYNILGKGVENLINYQTLNAGTYRVNFNGEKLSSGIYYYTFEAGNFVDTKRMILLK